MAGECINKQLFAQNLKEIRKSKMTMEELAARLNKSERSVAQLESGSRLTKLTTFVDICNALEVTPNRLLNMFLLKPIDEDSEERTSYEQLLEMISYMTPQEMDLAVDILKSIRKHSFKNMK